MLVMAKKNDLFLAALLCMGLLLSACNNGPDLEPVTRSDKATLSGIFYTESPDELIFPIKVLFALDCSGSMGAAGVGSDPENLRFNATLDFINRYNDYENVSFEVMLWNSTVFRRTMVGGEGGFTKDIDEIQSVFQGVNNTSLTDYVGTIDEIYSDIRRDIMNASDQENLVRTKYIVVFFSDGLDNVVGSPEPRINEINQGVGELYEMVNEAGVGSFNFHTFLLPGLNMTTEDREDCIDLMEGMAYRGNGQFRVFETADSIDFINIVDMRLTAEYLVKYIVAYNLNVRPGTNTLQLDSDGDGLTDEVELHPVDTWWQTNATDPYNADSDGDGLSDYFEYKASTPGNPMDPNVPDSPCQPMADGSYPDTDWDGLNDCEEYVKGTNRFHPDTDHDGIPDHVEFLAGTNPLENLTHNDSDFDGAVDWLEVQTHTNVLANDKLVRDRYSYFYNLVDRGIQQFDQGNGIVSNVRRFDFSISNIAIMGTRGCSLNGLPDLAPGENRIRMFVAEVPEDMPDAMPIFRVAEVVFDYNGDTREIRLVPADFQLLE